MLKAEVLLAKDLPKEPKNFSSNAPRSSPRARQIWLALINLAMYQAEKQTDAGGKRAEVEAGFGLYRSGRSERTWAIARSCARRGAVAPSAARIPRRSRVLKKLGENLGADGRFRKEQTHLWGSLATLSVQANDLDLARSYCRLVAEKEPNNIRIRHLLCELNLQAYEKGQTPDLQELDKLLNEIERLGGRGPFWLYGKAIRTFVQSKKTDPQLLAGGPRLPARGPGNPQGLGGPGRPGGQDLRDAGRTRSGIGILCPRHLSTWENATAT